MTDSKERTRTIELHEAVAWGDFTASAPAPLAAQHGIAAHPIGSAVACVAAKIDVLAYNRVVGLGMDGEVDDSTIDEIVGIYRSSGAKRFFIQLAPLTGNDELARRLEGHGFRKYNNWMKLWRDTSPPGEVQTDLRVERIDQRHSDAFARLIVEAFDWPEELAGWVAASVGNDGWHHYLAFADEKPVATAAMFVRDKIAWIDFASTLSEARGRGAQSALVARRFVDCAELGCDLITVETAEATDDKPAPSFRNMRRFGFDVAYARPNYIMEL